MATPFDDVMFVEAVPSRWLPDPIRAFATGMHCTWVYSTPCLFLSSIESIHVEYRSIGARLIEIAPKIVFLPLSTIVYSDNLTGYIDENGFRQ